MFSTRTRAIALSGLSAAVALPLLVAPAASAAPAPAATSVSTSVATGNTTSDRTQRASRSAARHAVFTRRVMGTASSLAGVPYRRGGTTPRGFDCSGYAQYVYRKAGHNLPRTASAQRMATTRISRANAKPGDLVFFHRGSNKTRSYHVGIYAGGNKLWHASVPGRPVAKANIWTSNVTFGRA